MAVGDPIHAKVRASTYAAGAVGVVLAILTWLSANPGVLNPLPQWLQGLILLILPPLLTFLAGYNKKADPPAEQLLKRRAQDGSQDI